MKIQINYMLPRKVIAEDVLAARGIELLCEIEGILTINSESHVFFEVSEINLLELAVHLHRWRYEHSASRDFVYISIEHDEPILVFSHLNEEQWVIDSIWRKCEALQVERHELISAVEVFLVRLDADLEKQYKLKSWPDYDYEL
ncbi:MAG: hypothetical protein FD169_2506 [Bacillota bacterium]|nr:MAG: hypothetical protein FD169_2506 [Bacillota bacterium]